MDEMQREFELQQLEVRAFGVQKLLHQGDKTAEEESRKLREEIAQFKKKWASSSAFL